jgi:hypothetical protein
MSDPDELYGRGPMMDALPAMREIEALPPEERARANREFVRDQLRRQGILQEATEMASPDSDWDEEREKSFRETARWMIEENDRLRRVTKMAVLAAIGAFISFGTVAWMAIGRCG